MQVKVQMCNIVKTLKSELDLTYDQIVSLGEGAFNRTQLSYILNHDGRDVSVEVIADVVRALGSTIEVHERNRLCRNDVLKRLEALSLKG